MRYFAELLKQDKKDSPLTIVDFGSKCVNGSYKYLFNNPQWRYVGIDMDSGSNVDIVLTDPYDWHQIASSSVDVVISGQTFEHAEYMWLSILEIERILKPNGLCCLIAPSTGVEHRFPVDCWRIYPDGFFALAKFAQLTPVHVETEWTPAPYEDDSAKWKDTVLIAAKSRATDAPGIDGVRLSLKEYIRRLPKTPRPEFKSILTGPSAEKNLNKPENYYANKRPELLPLLEPLAHANVLDIGCASGGLGNALKSLGCGLVYGVEVMNEPATMASRVYDKVFTCRIEDLDCHAMTGMFDFVVCADVLEHLVDPGAVLRSLRTVLKPSGAIVASIPNFRHRSIISMLIQGKFEYQPEGLLDNTHLRFFTFNSIVKLFNDAGYTVDSIGPKYPEGSDKLVDLWKNQDMVSKLKEVVRLLSGVEFTVPEEELLDFFTLQFLLRARPK
jgi:2-polyprenyl-3-methyl-5-hydroxy-6-metoxy-1,4-benzoquinol methylase